MKVLATADGLMLQLSLGDQQTLVRVAKQSGKNVLPRRLLEWLAQQYSANLEQDASDLITYTESDEVVGHEN